VRSARLRPVDLAREHGLSTQAVLIDHSRHSGRAVHAIWTELLAAGVDYVNRQRVGMKSAPLGRANTLLGTIW
jgi:hypothetical protein